MFQQPWPKGSAVWITRVSGRRRKVLHWWVLSFDTELKIFAALSKDTGDENSAYANGGKQTPWGAFRVFCLVICVAAALTQWMAING